MQELHSKRIDGDNIVVRTWYITTLILFMLSCSSGKIPVQETTIRDLALLPQDTTVYVQKATANIDLIQAEDLYDIHKGFVQKVFSPWMQSRPSQDIQEVLWGAREYSQKPMEGENRLPKQQGWVDKLLQEAHMESYPNMNKKGILVKNTSIRVLPTHKPAYYPSNLPGEGYPFDYMQNTAVWAGTPVFISHISKSGEWALVETSAFFGWVPIQNIGFISQSYQEKYATQYLVTPVRDNLPVQDAKGEFRIRARIGMVLPLIAIGKKRYTVLIPVRNVQGNALLTRAHVSKKDFAVIPLQLTPRKVAMLANEILGQAYGWAGMHFNRDCSSTLMDLFTPFGVWLPRNSKRQAEAGLFVSFDSIKDEDKKRVIMEHGIPFQTLLSMPGHIMLYIGVWKGEPIVFHTIWGVKTEESNGTEGRAIIGRTVITTLEPGIERSDVAINGSLLTRIKGMSILAPEVLVQSNNKQSLQGSHSTQ